MAAAVSTTPTAKLFNWSSAQPRADCVEKPQRRSRTKPRQNASGSRTASRTASTSTVKRSVLAHQGPAVASNNRSPSQLNASSAVTAVDSAMSAASAK